MVHMYKEPLSCIVYKPNKSITGAGMIISKILNYASDNKANKSNVGKCTRLSPNTIHDQIKIIQVRLSEDYADSI